MGEIESGLKQVRNRVGELGVEVGRVQVRVSELSLELRHLEEQVWERYRESLRRVAGDYHLRPPVTDAQRERLGQLRLTAPGGEKVPLASVADIRTLQGPER